MKRLFYVLYGLATYGVFFGTFLYAVGFVTGIGVPKDIETGPSGPAGTALFIDVLLLSVFALQHSIMARQSFKRWWTRLVPPPVERSTYVLFASLALILVFWQWRPIPAVVWQIESETVVLALTALSLVGWGMVLFSTCLINHFELFGVQQAIQGFLGRSAQEPRFRTPVLYKVVRHPIYLGFVIAFWATPLMSVGHLLFAAVTTGYILVGIAFEERDLIRHFGDEYRRYRDAVPMLFPLRRKPLGG